jgi:hypothetical protein
MREISYMEALREAMRRQCKRMIAFYYREDIGVYGGAFV